MSDLDQVSITDHSHQTRSTSSKSETSDSTSRISESDSDSDATEYRYDIQDEGWGWAEGDDGEMSDGLEDDVREKQERELFTLCMWSIFIVGFTHKPMSRCI